MRNFWKYGHRFPTLDVPHFGQLCEHYCIIIGRFRMPHGPFLKTSLLGWSVFTEPWSRLVSWSILLGFLTRTRSFLIRLMKIGRRTKGLLQTFVAT
jgi:hypothetical protein